MSQNPGSSAGPSNALKRTTDDETLQPCKRTKGAATGAGVMYEVKMLMLLIIRLMKTKCDFCVDNNVSAGDAFDDIVLKFKNKPVLVQLKLIEGDIFSERKNPLYGQRILKYMNSYIQLKKNWKHESELYSLGKFADACFILHTNCRFVQTCKLSNEITELFDTDSFCCKRHPDLRELLQLKFDESDCDAFLDNLFVFSSGRTEMELDDLIKNEMIVPEKEFLKLKACFEERHKDKDEYKKKLTPKHNPYIKFVDDWVASLFPTELKMNIKFVEQEVEDLKNKLILSGERVCIKSCQPILTCFKIKQYRHEKIILVNGSTLNENGDLLRLLDWWCDILVVVDDLDGQIDLPPIPKKGNKLICVSKSELPNMEIIDDELCLSKLDTDTQKRVLEGKVCLQGELTSLSKITGSDFNLIPVKAIIPLLKELSSPVELGNEYKDTGFYIKHSLIHYSELYRLDLLKTYDSQDGGKVAAVSGISEEKLQELVAANIKVGKGSGRRSCVYQIAAKSELNELKNCATIHWFHYGTEVLEHRENKGKIRLSDDYKIASRDYKDLDVFLSVPHRIVLVSDEPGMGKSTLVAHLSRGTKQQNPAHLVIAVNLNDWSKELRELKVSMELEDIYNFLLDVIGIQQEWKKFFKEKLVSMEDVYIIFDAFDEIAFKYDYKVLEMLVQLQKTKLKHLWIMTRPVMKMKLENCLSTVELRLKRFRNDQQKKLINELLRCELFKREIPVSDPLKLLEFTEKLLNVFQKNLKDVEKFTGIPLQCKLLAEAFDGEAEHYIATGKFIHQGRLNLLDLYKKFVDRKFDLYYEKNGIDLKKSGSYDITKEARESFERNLKIIALELLLKRESFKILKLSDRDLVKFKASFKQGKENIGFLTLWKTMVVFVHRTFGEYYAADWLADEENMKSKVVKKILREYLFKQEFKTVKHFWNRILSKGFKLHNAVMSLNVEEIQDLLSNPGQDVDEIDHGGRTALHLAKMCYSDVDDTKVVDQIIDLLVNHRASVTKREKIFNMTPSELQTKFAKCNG